MARMITCASVGVYEAALTRGREYLVLDEAPDRRQIKIRADNCRSRWFPAVHFAGTGEATPTLQSWQIDDPVPDPKDAWGEVSFTLSDGARR
jgi:hypothetical protein